MTGHMRCGCGWQARRDQDLQAPCPNCGGPVSFSPVPGPLLAQLLRERFGDDAAPQPAPPPAPPKPQLARGARDPGPRPRDPSRDYLPKPSYHKGRTLQELLDE